jgi:RHS repeat-associated protein
LKRRFYILFYNTPIAPHAANGNTTAEGGTNIQYNLLNLPQEISLLGGRSIQNTYAASGRKLKTVTLDNTEYTDGTKTYNGNLVFDKNGELEYILFDEGRILRDDDVFMFEYHLKDHLGSTRVAFVPTASGTEVVQENSYYPFGASIADLSWIGTSDNRYKREEKEYISDFDWNKYDFHARTFDPWNGRSLQIDPLAEKYFGSSPYALWGNNPVRVIDPTGMLIDDIYYNEQGYEIYRVEDNKTDRNFVIRTSQTAEQVYAENPREKGMTQSISPEVAEMTENEIKKGNLVGDHMSNVVELKSTATIKKIITTIGDDGTGGTATNNNREYGGNFTKTPGIIEQTKQGVAIDITKAEEVSITNVTWHSHPSGTAKVAEGTAVWIQPPSKHDIRTAKGVEYVIGMRSQTIYIYTPKGVLATIPLSVFKK